MEEQGINIDPNMALGLGSVMIKIQPPEPDALDASGTIITAPWPMSGGLQKLEKDDPGYGDGTASSTQQNVFDNINPVNSITTTIGFEQLESEEPANQSEDDFVVTYNDEEPEELPKRKTIELNGEAESIAIPSSKPHSSKQMFDDENSCDGDSLPSLVTMVDNIIRKEQTGEAENSADKSLTETHLSHENGEALSDEQRSLDEIQVVEEGFEDFEEGELIKDYAQSRHGTNSETFLSQMHFFGGRTWARGRGKRGHGRGRDITNIALKLIETDQMETDSEQGASLDEVDQIKTVTDSVRSGRGKSSDHGSPALPQRKSTRATESKERVSTRATEPKELDISSLPAGAEQCSRKQATKGRGKSLGGREFKNKKDQTKDKSEPLPTENEDVDVEYESNDEDTMAAIRASLEEMNKNNNKTKGDNSAKDDNTTVTDDTKTAKSSKKANSKKDAKVKKDVSNLKMNKNKKKNDENSKKAQKEESADNTKSTDHSKKGKSDKSKDNPKKGKNDGKSDNQNNKTSVEKTTKSNNPKKVTNVTKTTSNKTKAQTTAKKGKSAKPATENSDKNGSEEMEVEYESNDEDTQAAIKASLEELEKEKQRQREKELEKQKADKNKKKKEKLPQQKSLTPVQKSVIGKRSSKFSGKDFLSAARTKQKNLRKGNRHSSRLTADVKASTSRCESSSTERRATRSNSPDSRASVPTQKKVEKISANLRKKILNSANSEEKRKGRSSDVSDFDGVVNKFLHTEESPDDVSSSTDIGRKGKQKQAAKRKNAAQDKSDSVHINVESDEERRESLNYVSPSTKDNFHSVTAAPHVKLQKLCPVRGESSSRSSSHSSSAAPTSKKRVHDALDDEHDAGSSRSKMARKLSSELPFDSSQHAENSSKSNKKAENSQQSGNDCSITSITPAIDTSKQPKSNGKGDSLTKSVGDMMSYLFGDKLSEECPNGFVVNVRLEVEKKKDNNEGASNSSSGTCCKAEKPELCPCLQKVPDLTLASVLKERVEKRRDLTVTAKGALLAAILNFMQELEAASAPS